MTSHQAVAHHLRPKNIKDITPGVCGGRGGLFSTEEEEADEFNKSDITKPALIRLTNRWHILDFMTPNKTVSKQYGLCLNFDC